jgi:LysR family transcriptional regulator, transcription activator of glutamate synthase operon
MIEGVMNDEFDMALIGPVPKHGKKIVGTTLFTDNIVALLLLVTLWPNSQR